MTTKEEAKHALDKLIQKSRVHLYKPIQIAEILYHDRIYHDIDLAVLEDYRTKSKKWRDEISKELLGRVLAVLSSKIIYLMRMLYHLQLLKF